MTFVTVPITVDEPSEVTFALERAAALAKEGAAMIEWRVDAMARHEVAMAAISKLSRDCPLPCIVTCRTAREGGGYTGTDADLRALVRDVMELEHPPRFVDVELASLQAEPDAWREALSQQEAADEVEAHEPGKEEADEDERSETSVIVSVHDFNERPSDLIRRIETMTNEPACQVMKAAWHARSLRDNLEAFDLLSERRKPMMALCMGPFGLMSRVLAPKFGGFITFAAADDSSGTASGQPTLDELENLYRIERVNAETKVYGVIGWPLAHSFGPIIHNRGFAELNWNGVYMPMPIAGGTEAYEPFKATVGAMVDHSRLHFRGASVTMPHKENLLRFVEERGGRIDAFSTLAGAANTILVGATGAMACRNTDVPAMLDSICDAFNVDPEGLEGTRVAVLGAGGVARASVAGLLPHGARITVYNRTPRSARKLVEEFKQKSEVAGYTTKLAAGNPSSLSGRRFDLIINATSIGMAGGPAPDLTPFEKLCPDGGEAKLDDRVTVFDTVYNPSRTPLIADAESRGCRVILGIEMFLRQAALQFESWTGENAPTDAMREALLEYA